MKVEIRTKDIFGKKYHHKIDNAFSIYDDKNEVFIRYMEGDSQTPIVFLKKM